MKARVSTIVAVALVVVFAGCGGSDGGESRAAAVEEFVEEIAEERGDSPVQRSESGVAEGVVDPNTADPDPGDASDVDSTEPDSAQSVPANIWPEEIVDTPADAKDVVTRSAGDGEVGVLPEGVGSVTAVVTSADGDVCEVCLWLADDDVSRQRGLMGVTDLGDAVGMAFVWEQPRTGNFFMFQTPTPLSIAWFDTDGDHVGQADMEPCLVEDSAACERYTADSPYVTAVEMFDGQLEAIGIGPGSSIELLDLPCA